MSPVNDTKIWQFNINIPMTVKKAVNNLFKLVFVSYLYFCIFLRTNMADLHKDPCRFHTSPL